MTERDILGLVLCFCLVSGTTLHAEDKNPKTYKGAKDKLHIYLLIGQSNMAGRAPFTKKESGAIPRCYLLNGEDKWEPAKNPLNRYSTIRKELGMQKMNPGYTFSQCMLKKEKGVSLGLIVNAKGGTKIEQWGKGSQFYKDALRRAKVAQNTGTLKGILWHQGESNDENPDGYLDKLRAMVENFRRDFDSPNLPFVAGQVNNVKEINDQIAELPQEVPFTAFVSSKGLKAMDRWHFDAKSMKLLGSRYAEEMLKIQAKLKAEQANAVSGETYVDIHFHADARPRGGGDLPKVVAWMKTNCVDRLIVMQYRKTLPRNDEEAKQIVENFKQYQGKLYRFCVLLPSDISSKAEAVKALTKHKAEGAIGFGEHYGRKLFFDDPKCMRLYAACAEVGLPVLFHMDDKNNKDDASLSHLENALTSYPNCVFIGHGPGFWAKMKVVDGLLDKHKNLYADISAGSGARAIGRDKEFSRTFMTRHANRVLFGTDFAPYHKEPPQQFKLVESLKLKDDVKAKLCRENAISLFALDRQ